MIACLYAWPMAPQHLQQVLHGHLDSAGGQALCPDAVGQQCHGLLTTESTAWMSAVHQPWLLLAWPVAEAAIQQQP